MVHVFMGCLCDCVCPCSLFSVCWVFGSCFDFVIHSCMFLVFSMFVFLGVSVLSVLVPPSLFVIMFPTHPYMDVFQFTWGGRFSRWRWVLTLFLCDCLFLHLMSLRLQLILDCRFCARLFLFAENKLKAHISFCLFLWSAFASSLQHISWQHHMFV